MQIIGAVWTGLKAVLGAINVIRWFQRRADKRAQRRIGAQAEKLRSKEKGDEARARMDAVEPAGDAATRKRLRKRSF